MSTCQYTHLFRDTNQQLHDTCLTILYLGLEKQKKSWFLGMIMGQKLYTTSLPSQKQNKHTQVNTYFADLCPAHANHELN